MFIIMIYWFFPLKNFSLIWRRHHCRWRATKFKPMLGAQGLWAGRYLYLATPAVTRGLGFSGLIRRIAPFSRLLRPTRGCGGSILIRIITELYAFKYITYSCIISSTWIYNSILSNLTCIYIISSNLHLTYIKSSTLLPKIRFL
jgi:hypothetical protein